MIQQTKTSQSTLIERFFMCRFLPTPQKHREKHCIATWRRLCCMQCYADWLEWFSMSRFHVVSIDKIRQIC